MRVCVIGSAGQLGSDIVRTQPHNVELIGLTHQEIDITRSAQLRSILADLKPAGIINTAAFHRTDACEDDPELSFSVNAIAVRDLGEIARDIGSIVIHVSTDYVFDGTKKFGEPYLEADRPNPLNTYGVSKFAGELYLMNILENSYVVRVASLFGGYGARGKGGNFVTAIRKKAAEANGAVKVICDIGMSPTYTVDAASAIWSLLAEKRDYGIYHIANDGYCTWYEFAKAVIELSGSDCDLVPVPHTEYPTRAIRPRWSGLSSQKGMENRSWREALRVYIAELARDVLAPAY
jgi:dTDP-4-dehydrorhamnose reductase